MKKLVIIALTGIAIMSFSSCKSCKKKEKQEVKEETTSVQSYPEPEPVAIIVREDYIYDIPVAKVSEEVPQAKTASKKTTTKQTTAKNETKATAPPATPPVQTKIVTRELEKELAKRDVLPVKKVDTTFFCFKEDKLNTLKTVTSYQKRGEEVMKVVSDPQNPDVVDYVVLTNRKGNADVYGVKVGLTAKETRHLRQGLRHFIKKGKVFLYTEDSNIMYELDGVTSEGKTITKDEIDKMHVATLIWKDKSEVYQRKVE